jgi:hypothetical protein
MRAVPDVSKATLLTSNVCDVTVLTSGGEPA